MHKSYIYIIYCFFHEFYGGSLLGTGDDNWWRHVLRNTNPTLRR